MTDAHPDESPVGDLADEFARRWHDGERPSVEEYAARSPRRAAEIRDVFIDGRSLDRSANRAENRGQKSEIRGQKN
jgi:hypothetical protein